MSELTATSVLVIPGADVRKVRTHEPARVVGPCRHAGTGQEGVCVEGPPGVYTYHTLEAFSRLFEVPPSFVQQIRPEAPAVPGKVADQTHRGKGY